MDVLQKLGLALGFAALAGLNLYLTVFATSVAIHFGWVVLSPEYQKLAILGETPIMIVAGVLYFVEFFADKVPWLDSAWDAVHTAIRPIGGAFLAVKTLGQADPVFDVIIALIAGGVTLTVHGAKAGTRLVANGSPEPFSNVALSLGEDVGVLGGLGLMDYSYHHNPYLALVVFGLFVLTLLYVTPKIFRFTRIRVWLLWKKLASPPADEKSALPRARIAAGPRRAFLPAKPGQRGDCLGRALSDGQLQGRPADELFRLAGRHRAIDRQAAFRGPAGLALTEQDAGSGRLQGVARIAFSERRLGGLPSSQGDETGIRLRPFQGGSGAYRDGTTARAAGHPSSHRPATGRDRVGIGRGLTGAPSSRE